MPLFSRLRTRLFLLAALIILPIIVYAVLLVVNQRQFARDQAVAATQRLTGLIYGAEGIYTDQAEEALRILTQVPEVRDGTPEQCDQFFASILPNFPAYMNLSKADINGDGVCSAVPMTQPINVADRPYFQAAVRQRSFSVGDYQMGRITGKPGLNYGYPILDANNNVTGVVVVTLDLEWASRFVSTTQFPPGTTFEAIDQNNVVVARYPDPNQWLGRTLTDATLLAMARSSSPNELVEVSDADGVTRLYTYAHLGGADMVSDNRLTVFVGVPADITFATANQLLVQSLFAIAATVLITLLLAWLTGEKLVLQKVRTLLDAARKLAAGDLSARTGAGGDAGEFGVLARTFDNMAESLEQRDLQIHQYAEQLEERVSERTAELQSALGREHSLNEMRTRFTSMASHELRTPLATIMTTSGLLTRYYERMTAEQRLGHFDNIEIQVKFLTSMLDDMLALSRAEAAAAFNTISLDLEAYCQELIDEVKTATRTTDTVLFTAQGDCMPFLGNRESIRQMVLNLLTNAIKYSPAGSTVRIDLACDAGQVKLCVADQGIGIPAAAQEHLFEAFYRADNVGTIAGTGLGLPIVKRAVDAHHGTIAVESSAEFGTTFTIRLPMSPPDEPVST